MMDLKHLFLKRKVKEEQLLLVKRDKSADTKVLPNCDDYDGCWTCLKSKEREKEISKQLKKIPIFNRKKYEVVNTKT